jgi:signal transduction histidine kinase
MVAPGAAGHAAGMATSVPDQRGTRPPGTGLQAAGPRGSGLRGRAGSWLPRGALLREQDWHWRHAAVCLLLGAHLPVLAVWSAVAGPPGELWHVLLPLALLVGSRVRRLSRRVRSLSAALGLLTCSALVVHLGSQAPEAHVHFFVAVAVIALYQDWTVYALAIAFVLAHHGWLALGPGGREDWTWAAVHALAVGAESAVLVLFWRANELSREAEDLAREALAAGQSRVQARIDDAERLRYDLIGTVSHEFRTPLTGIRGAALTLLKRGDRLDSAGRERLLRAVLEQQERLSRLLENMLLAAKVTEADRSASTDVEQVATAVAAAVPAGTHVAVVVEPGLRAHIDRRALEQVLQNLVDNALHHGARGSMPLVAGGRDDAGVWLTVSNEGRVLDLTRKDELFQPFTQVDSTATREREGIGVGLFVVSRLVEAYGGSVDVDSHSGWVTVEVRLRSGEPSRTAPVVPAPLPVA